MEHVVIKCPHCGQLEQMHDAPQIDARVVCKRCEIETDYRLMRDEWIAALRERVSS